MTRKSSKAGRETPSMKAVPETAQGGDEQIVARPDGYYWVAPDGRQEVGPFSSLEEALADMQSADAPEPGESLQEAESELGIADWIDPDTGEPAEGLSPPHLDGE